MGVRVTIRAGGKVISRTVNEWSTWVALAALSAEPESLNEFFAAMRRYQPNHRWDECGQPAAIEDSIRGDGASCLIDVDSRSVFAGGDFELPDRRGAYQADEDDRADGFPVVWLNTPDDWLFESAGADWLNVIDERARAHGSRKQFDTRAVLFGRPMLDFLANRVRAAAVEGDNERYDEQIRAIHAEWLMTPRDELLGRTPREVLLRNRHQIELDIQFRSEQWSIQGFAPPALDEDSAAYRFAGYGTTEVVIHFDLIRSLLGSAWEWVLEGASHHKALVERLAEHRDEFLNQPLETSTSELTCRELIENERRRMPITAEGSHLDCDCPICQMAADGAFGSGPMFIGFDGHHLELEDEFAFSMTESRDEWEKEQERFQRRCEEMDRKMAEREASGEEAQSVWTSSFIDWDTLADESPIPGKMAIGFLLAELVGRLQQVDGGRPHIDALNGAFARFQRTQDRVVEDSASEELRDGLEHVADTCPDLTPQCADLQSRLDEVIRASRDRSGPS